MFQKTLTLAELGIHPSDVYRQMGYGEHQPDTDIVRETHRLMAEAAAVAVPRYCFTVMRGTLGSTAEAGVNVAGRTFHTGNIIARQLEGAEAFAVFTATAGTEYEQWRKQQSDLVATYMADALGSVIAERCADQMEQALQATIDKLGWHRTNRFSPGYCGWSVAEQQQLLPLLGTPNPCGVTLTDSSLMVPIKSVSGIIGLGPSVSYRDYTCGLCTFEHCFRRKQRFAPAGR